MKIKIVYKHIWISIVFVILSLVIVNNSLCNNEFKFADSTVIDVSSGPRHNVSTTNSFHYRIITILVETSLIVYYQQITYGDENCCLAINFSREIEGEKLEGNLELFNIKDIKWLAYDTVEFIGNSTKYTIKFSDKTYTVKKSSK